MNDPRLRELAARAGIETGYRDTWGHHHEASDATLRALLRAMGLAADDPQAMEAAFARLASRAQAGLSPHASAARAWRPDALAGDGRRWGLAVQLYGLRNDKTWGIGDFSALAECVRGAAALGASAVGVNPLHALFPTRPGHASPYSPSSRRFLNPLYLDVEAIAEFASCDAARRAVVDAAFQRRLAAACAAELVDYRTVAELKYSVLAVLYKVFRIQYLTHEDHSGAADFRRFQQQEGPSLRRFATFHALAEAQPEMDWRKWPEGLADPDSASVEAFAATHVEAIEFHEYLQWQAALQLARVADTARACGMEIGLYVDLAVGADPTGAESWSMQAFLARGATIGAPPDALNLFGQDWGSPPPDPFALARGGHAPLAELWERNMRHAGALRIDHIMGLVRLYWIPAGMRAADGAYVRYPWHDLLGLLAAQSQRHQCMVIGEDLGTVPEGLREAMRDLGMLAYRLLYFEQQDGRFRAPHEYPADALVAVGTHDLPPLPMWWAGEDIELRTQLDLWPSDDARRAEYDTRQWARGALTAALQREGLHSGDVPAAAPVEAVYAYLARTPCKLLMVQLEDILDLHVQTNVPGTVAEHPNWRRRLPCSTGEALAHPRMRRIAELMHRQGRSDT